MKPIQTIEKVISEEAELYCECRGSGPLLLLITGGMGDAGFYSSAADILANEFTVLNYDRRCNSRSTGDRSKNRNLDAAKATGFNDSICNCASCDHKVASECMKVRCSCCREINHSMVLDGIEGFTPQGK
jgi:hypothetical protein